MSKKKNEDEEVYTFTPKGFFEHKIEMPEILDKLLVFMVHTGNNALIWNDVEREWEFAKVDMVIPKKGKKK